MIKKVLFLSLLFGSVMVYYFLHGCPCGNTHDEKSPPFFESEQPTVIVADIPAQTTFIPTTTQQ